MYLRWSLLVSWCFASIESMSLIWDRKKGESGVRGRIEMNSSSTRSDPQRPKRASATARTTMLRRWGPRQCEVTCVLRINLRITVLTAVRSQVGKTVSTKQLLRNQLCSKTNHPNYCHVSHTWRAWVGKEEDLEDGGERLSCWPYLDSVGRKGRTGRRAERVVMLAIAGQRG